MKEPENFIFVIRWKQRSDYSHYFAVYITLVHFQAMWLILQQEKAEDFVVATGETHTVREFIEKSFALVDVKIR